MLDEVGDPGLAGVFVARADIDPEPERYGTDSGDPLGDHPESVLEF
jgi:hypothetical protein